MKALIINNRTTHLEELRSLFIDSVVIEKENLDNNLDISGYDVIVFSGGSNTPTVLEHPEYYTSEINIIKQSKIPIVGICLGAEIIVEALGGELYKLPERHRGGVLLKIEDEELKSKIGADNLEVSEGHAIGIKTLPKDFISCASSEHGIEIIRHKARPIFGFQFHPEILPNKKLIDWLFEDLFKN